MPPTRLRPSPFATSCFTCLRPKTIQPSLLPLSIFRPASHASQGRANKAAPGPGKRLGAKKGASELVVPGNIIFRQRGTHWFPGENCDMGRDHTIFAKEKGYVTYYRDPETHPKRKYIGVVFERGMKLPVPRNAPRRRRLGMVGRERELSTVARPMEPVTETKGAELEGRVEAQGTIRRQGKKARGRVQEVKHMELKSGYQYRDSNWHIGRAAERAKVVVREYKRGDRFLAWRKLNARKARNAEKKAMGSRKKKGNSK